MALEMIELVETKLIVANKFVLRASCEDIGALMSSIRSKGLLQPIIVRPSTAGFELVAGHRRFTACRKLGWIRIPCIVKELNEREAFELALVENVQRRTLDPVDEATAFRKYVHDHGRGGVTDLAKKIGKSEEYVSHRIGLLSLPQSVLKQISRHRLSVSSAYELKMVKDLGLQERVADLAVQNKINVRGIRNVAKLANEGTSIGFIEETGLRQNLFEDERSELADPEVQQAITILRMCLIRLDALLHTMREGETRTTLHKMRLDVHTLIDDLMRFGATRRVSQMPHGRVN